MWKNHQKYGKPAYTIVYIYETPNNQSNKTSPEPLDTVMIKLNEINSSSIYFLSYYFLICL